MRGKVRRRAALDITGGASSLSVFAKRRAMNPAWGGDERAREDEEGPLPPKLLCLGAMTGGHLHHVQDDKCLAWDPEDPQMR